MPYFYSVSRGEYGDFWGVYIYHEEKFTSGEFSEMYNNVLETLEIPDVDDIAEALCITYGFQLVETTFNIHTNGFVFKPVQIQDVESDAKTHVVDE